MPGPEVLVEPPERLVGGYLGPGGLDCAGIETAVHLGVPPSCGARRLLPSTGEVAQYQLPNEAAKRFVASRSLELCTFLPAQIHHDSLRANLVGR